MTGGPIFILGIQRGGTNQILNILRSHPATCWPQGEFHEVFRPRSLRAEKTRGLAKLRRYAPICLTAGDILDPDTPPAARDCSPGRAAGRSAPGLEGPAAANHASVAAYKAALAEQGFFAADPPPPPDRMLTKALNYNLVFVPDLLALWPDARFVGVIRDGRAVCEGHIARGASVAEASAVYTFVGGQLDRAAGRRPAAPDLALRGSLADTAGSAAAIYDFCGLDRAATRGGSACRTRSAS